MLLLVLWLPPVPAQPMLSVSVGQVGIADHLERPQWYGVEYRWAPSERWGIVPGAGYARSACGANYIHLDFRRPFQLTRRWVLTPHFGPGVFNESDQIRLGHELQFRSGLELSYRTRRGKAFGFGVTHLSNGGIGRLNPGTETLTLSFAMPL